MKLQNIIDFMEKICPPTLAEDWDNVGLLLGSRQKKVDKILTCLTIDKAVVDEAIAEGVDCIVSHHPFPFHSAKKWTTDTTDGTLLLKLVGAQISVYSPHTAHDSAFFGVNRQLAEGLCLVDVKPLYEGKLPATREMLAGLDAEEEEYLAGTIKAGEAQLGTGRIGRLSEPKKFSEFIAQIKDMLQIEGALAVGPDDRLIKTVAIGCGAADDLIGEAARRGADAILLGEARFHACLEARAQNICAVLAGHYSTERFSMVILAERLKKEFPSLTVKASAKESDPIRIV